MTNATHYQSICHDDEGDILSNCATELEAALAGEAIAAPVAKEGES